MTQQELAAMQNERRSIKLRNVFGLYERRPASFKSDFSLPDSIENLRLVTKRSVFASPTRQCVVGKVTEESVSLRRERPFVGNPFKPYFVGGFKAGESGVVLSGVFTIPSYVKVLYTIWLSFFLFATIHSAAQAPHNGLINWGGLVIGSTAVVLGILMLIGSRWLARHDVEWLSQVITAALANKRVV